MPKKVSKDRGGKPKVHPVDTRLRQFLTEVLLDIDEGTTADERGEIIEACMAAHADVLVTTAEAFLSLAVHGLESADDEEDDDHEEGDE